MNCSTPSSSSSSSFTEVIWAWTLRSWDVEVPCRYGHKNSARCRVPSAFWYRQVVGSCRSPLPWRDGGRQHHPCRRYPRRWGSPRGSFRTQLLLDGLAAVALGLHGILDLGFRGAGLAGLVLHFVVLGACDFRPVLLGVRHIGLLRVGGLFNAAKNRKVQCGGHCGQASAINDAVRCGSWRPPTVPVRRSTPLPTTVR